MARSPHRACCGALGFGADRVFFVSRVRCYGCPRYPFPTLKLVTLVGADKTFASGVDYDYAIDFEWVSVERKTEGEMIETAAGRGWAFHEFARVPTASRVHADALTLMAMFLAHWDNKPENQRLICLSGKPGATADARGRWRCCRTSAARSGRARRTWTDGETPLSGRTAPPAR